MQFLGENVHPLEQRFSLSARFNRMVRYPLFACLESLKERQQGLLHNGMAVLLSGIDGVRIPDWEFVLSSSQQ